LVLGGIIGLLSGSLLIRDRRSDYSYLASVRRVDQIPGIYPFKVSHAHSARPE
jgi:hypothetical protein